jgi:CBS domain-containing protein
MTLVSEAMDRSPAFIGPDADLAEAAGLLESTEAAHLLVLDEGNLVGILCRCDVRDAARDERVSDRMAVPVMTVRPDDTLEDAALTMCECGLGCVPVALGGLVLGTITSAELERAGLEPPPHRSCHDSGEAPQLR